MINKNENSLSLIIMSILYFVLGVVFIAATNKLLTTFNYILVSICLVIGVVQMLGFVFGKKWKDNDFNDLLVGMVFIWVSLVLYVYHYSIINLLPILFSLYLFFVACDMLSRYFRTRDIVNYNGKKYIILSLLALIVGILLIFNPGEIILTYLKVTGVYLILVGILFFLEFINSFKKKEVKNGKDKN